MKGVIFVLAALLSISIALGTDAELWNPMGSCDSSGNILASYIHSGGILNTGDIEMKAVFPDTNSTVPVEGYWEKDDENFTYLQERSAGGSTRFFFHSTNSPFTKTGDYVFKLTFLASTQDYYNTDVSLKVSCPGIDCVGDSGCREDEFCSEGRCTPLKCGYGEYVEFNRCDPICNDKNPCTEDIYSNGHCIYKRTGECCLSNEDCNDGAACTTERCVNSECVYSPVKCEAATDRCVTSKCIEPRGCVYETDEQCLGVENEKREYFITIGTPTVQKKSFFTSVGEWLDNFFRNLF